MSSSPSSNTPNSPTGPAPIISTSVLIGSLIRKGLLLGDLFARLSSGQAPRRKGEIASQRPVRPCRLRERPASYARDRENSVNDQPAERPKKPAPLLADYPHRVSEIVRFGDLDPQGHANQAVFLTYFESGRVAMFRDPDLGIGVPGL